MLTDLNHVQVVLVLGSSVPVHVLPHPIDRVLGQDAVQQQPVLLPAATHQ